MPNNKTLSIPLFQNKPRDYPPCRNAVYSVSTFAPQCRKPSSWVGHWCWPHTSCHCSQIYWAHTSSSLMWSSSLRQCSAQSKVLSDEFELGSDCCGMQGAMLNTADVTSTHEAISTW